MLERGPSGDHLRGREPFGERLEQLTEPFACFGCAGRVAAQLGEPRRRLELHHAMAA